MGWLLDPTLWSASSEAWSIQPSLNIFLPLLKGFACFQCSRTCGKGWRKRTVACKSTNPSARAQLLHDTACTSEPKPRTHEVCLLKRCHKHKKLQWLVSAWTQVFSPDSLRTGSTSLPQAALRLPPLPSLHLLTASKTSFLCLEPVSPLISRSPASLAFMMTSLNVQSVLTTTPVAEDHQ